MVTRTITIDCTAIKSVAAFWQRYLDAVQPADGALFGRNLDAFWDALEGGGPGAPGDVRLEFINSDDLADLRMDDGRSFRDALQELAHAVTHTPILLR